MQVENIPSEPGSSVQRSIFKLVLSAAYVELIEYKENGIHVRFVQMGM